MGNNFAILWRLLANALEFIGSLPISQAFLQIPGSLANVCEELTTLKGEQLFELAARCYCRAIKHCTNDVLLWYELALNYYLRAIQFHSCGTDERVKHLNLAAETAKHTIKLLPSRWMNWNLLGVICATTDINNLPLAQHCFIKALELNKKAAVAWTNLGVLYLSQGEIKLANKAFSRSQQSDTSYENAWTGQACIAERIGESVEAMDLFKHCTSLGFSKESALGFTHWVCSVLDNAKFMSDPKFKYFIEQMHAVPLALDSIEWYCKKEDANTSLESLCLLGYLYYQQKLYPKAIRAFSKALDKADGLIK